MQIGAGLVADLDNDEKNRKTGGLKTVRNISYRKKAKSHEII